MDESCSNSKQEFEEHVLRKRLRESRDGRKLFEKFLQRMIESSIEEGRIRVSGKSETELWLAVRDHAQNVLSSGGLKKFSVDHRTAILREARRFSQRREYEVALVFYAIWFEHWLNHLVIYAGTQLKLNYEELVQVIRAANTQGKLSWVPKLLGLPPIHERHRSTILELMNHRNSYVHYKWTFVDFDSKAERIQLEKLMLRIEKSIKYALWYDGKYLLHGNKKLIRKLTGQVVRASLYGEKVFLQT